MADLSALEELLLGGYDVGALLAAQASAGQAPGGLLGLGGGLKPPLTQSGLGWAGPAPTDQSSIYQEVAQSLAAKLEEHRMQQVQVATALQTLQQLQQQEALANLTHQYLHQHGAQARAGNPFQRSRTTDLESLGRGPAAYDPMLSPGAGAAFGAGGLSPADFDSHRAQLAALQHAAASSGHPGPHPSLALQRVPGVVGLQHNLPVRSFSSEQLVAGQRNRPQPGAGPGIMGGPGQQGPSGSGGSGGMNGQAGAGKRAPLRQPSGLGPNGRQGQNQAGGHGGGNNGGGANGNAAGVNGNSGAGGQRGAGDGGRRARYAATAKAPSWASEDWHPMKAVMASGAHATGGTGVFLPHLATPPATPGSGGSGTGSGGATAAGSDSAAGAVKTGLASPATSVGGGGGGGPGTSGANGAGAGLGSGRNSCDRASDHSASHRHSSGHSHSHVASANASLSGLGSGLAIMPAGPAGMGPAGLGHAPGPGAGLHPLHAHPHHHMHHHPHPHHHQHHASGPNAIGGHGPLLATPHPGMSMGMSTMAALSSLGGMGGMGGLGGAPGSGSGAGLAHVTFAPPGGAPLSPLSPRDGVSPTCSAESNALGSGSGGLGSGAQALTTTCSASHCASATGASLASLGLAPSDLGLVGGLGGLGGAVASAGVAANGGVGSYSRGTTLESFSRASTTGWPAGELDCLSGGPQALAGAGGGSSVAAAAGFLTAGGADGMKVVAEEPEREREDALLEGEGECDFASLARELADLMSKQQQQGGAE